MVALEHLPGPRRMADTWRLSLCFQTVKLSIQGVVSADLPLASWSRWRTVQPGSPGFLGHLSSPGIVDPQCFLDLRPPAPSWNISSVSSGILLAEHTFRSQPLLQTLLSFFSLQLQPRGSPRLLESLPKFLGRFSLTSCTSRSPLQFPRGLSRLNKYPGFP